jgi:hypothetical protein
MTTKTRLTVGVIRKAIKNLADDAEVLLEVATDGLSGEIEQALADVVLEHAFRDVLNDVLVIDGQID